MTGDVPCIMIRYLPKGRSTVDSWGWKLRVQCFCPMMCYLIKIHVPQAVYSYYLHLSLKLCMNSILATNSMRIYSWTVTLWRAQCILKVWYSSEYRTYPEWVPCVLSFDSSGTRSDAFSVAGICGRHVCIFVHHYHCTGRGQSLYLMHISSMDARQTLTKKKKIHCVIMF